MHVPLILRIPLARRDQDGEFVQAGGIELLKRRYSPPRCTRSASSGPRNHGLNGLPGVSPVAQDPGIAARGPDMITSAAVRCFGVISSSEISLNRLSSLCAAADPPRTHGAMMQTL